MSSPAETPGWAMGFRAMGSSNFRRWFIGQSISQSGFWLQLVAQALLVLDLTNSGTLLGIVSAAQFVPMVVLGPWAGVLGDRVDKRRLLIVTQSVMMLSAVVLGVVVLAGSATYGIVLTLATVTGIAFALDQPSRRVIVTELVDQDVEANAIALNSLTGNGAKVVGPALAGVLVGTVGLGWCFVLNGVSYLAVLGSLVSMDVDEIRRSPPETSVSGMQQIREGLGYSWRDREIRVPLVMLSIVVAVAHNANVLLPMLVNEDFDDSAALLGLFMAVMSVGAVVGTVYVAHVAGRGPPNLAVWAIGMGVALVALALSMNAFLISVSAALVGVTSMVLFSSMQVGLQMQSAVAMRSRVMSLFAMAFLGGHALGAPVSGWMAEALGVDWAIALGGFAAILTGAVAWRFLPARQRPENVTKEALGRDRHSAHDLQPTISPEQWV